MNQIANVLLEVNKEPGINQRGLSKKCDISLGKINSLIEDIEYNNYVTKEIQGREHKYCITKKGISYLQEFIDESKKKYINLHSNMSQVVDTAVILAAGRNSEFNTLVCLNKIDSETMIERTIRQLQEIGINNIIVVGGYKIEELKAVIPSDVTVVSNTDFKWTGTMSSLSKVNPYIKGDFLLVESDIVVETAGLENILRNEKRDCMLITVESGSGDEALVEIQDERIHKISKDIRQLNRIDGEMIGISKISYEFFNQMIHLYKNNQNPYLNYEYLMLDVARSFYLGYLKMDNLLWHEVDSHEHLNYVLKKLLRKIDKKEKMALIQNLKTIVSDCLAIDEEEISDISVIGGMTNKNYKVIVNQVSYVLRVPGNGTESMISRRDEIKNAEFAHKIGVDAELIYFNEETGIKISKFIEDAQTLSAESVKKQHIMEKVCAILNTLHTSNLRMENEFNIFEKIEQYELLLKEANGSNFDDYIDTKEKILRLKNIMSKLNIELTACHNDTLAENFILGKGERLYLIDWEYGGMNDPMWDVAAHCLESEFNEDEEELFLRLYFGKDPEEEYKLRVLINKIYQDFLWSIWTNIKEASGDDFGTYGIDRYNRAKSNLDMVFELVEG